MTMTRGSSSAITSDRPADVALQALSDLPVGQQLEMALACRLHVGGFTTEAFAAEIHTIVRRSGA